jgi:hypothetical protein
MSDERGVMFTHQNVKPAHSSLITYHLLFQDRPLRFAWIFLLLSLCAACAQTAPRGNNEPVVLSIGSVTPAAVAEELIEVDSLAQAAQQLADALGVAADQVRVRIRFDQCITCNADQYAAASSSTGLTLAEAEERLKPGATLWLFVDAFTCTYSFDGTRLTPQTCQFAPL